MVFVKCRNQARWRSDDRKHPYSVLEIFILFLATIENYIVVLPTLRGEFLDCFRQPSEEQNKIMVRQALEYIAQESSERREYLKREK